MIRYITDLQSPRRRFFSASMVFGFPPDCKEWLHSRGCSRPVDWSSFSDRDLALAMGTHWSLGSSSPIQALPTDAVRLIASLSMSLFLSPLEAF